MTHSLRVRCGRHILTGHRMGQVCGKAVSEVIVWNDDLGPPALVCGYHARAFASSIRYPLWANWATIRRLQWATLEANR